MLRYKQACKIRGCKPVSGDPLVTDHFPSLLDDVAGLQQVLGRHRYVLGEVVVVVGERAGRMVVRALTGILARLDPARGRADSG